MWNPTSTKLQIQTGISAITYVMSAFNEKMVKFCSSDPLSTVDCHEVGTSLLVFFSIFRNFESVANMFIQPFMDHGEVSILINSVIFPLTMKTAVASL